jgi:hypothetical protein
MCIATTPPLVQYLQLQFFGATTWLNFGDNNFNLQLRCDNFNYIAGNSNRSDINLNLGATT